jgi:hypothetical protein
LKQAWANSSARPYLEKTLHKNRAGGVAQGEDPEFKPQYHTYKIIIIIKIMVWSMVRDENMCP